MCKRVKASATSFFAAAALIKKDAPFCGVAELDRHQRECAVVAVQATLSAVERCRGTMQPSS
jgi:hypothetical protein